MGVCLGFEVEFLVCVNPSPSNSGKTTVMPPNSFLCILTLNFSIFLMLVGVGRGECLVQGFEIRVFQSGKVMGEG